MDFLPITLAAVRSAADSPVPPAQRAAARVVQRRAEDAEESAAECWHALLAGADSPARRALPGRLHALTDATAVYTGSRWWHAEGTGHRRRVAEAQHEVADAVRRGDAAGFAAALLRYDLALATAVVEAQADMGSSSA